MMTQTSIDKLNTCHPDIIKVITEASKYLNICVVCGYRNEADQNDAYKNGKSKLKFPFSKHNSNPSNAVDIAPMIGNSISWDSKLIIYYIGIIMGIAIKMNIKLRWGGDWNCDFNILDNTFNDLVHLELLK